MGFIRKIPIFTFYYLMPMSLGFVTGLVIKDSQILSNKRKISMSVFSYYSNIDENIPIEFLKGLPDLEYLRNSNNKDKNNDKQNNEKIN